MAKDLEKYNSTSQLYFENNNKILAFKTYNAKGDNATRRVVLFDCGCEKSTN